MKGKLISSFTNQEFGLLGEYAFTYGGGIVYNVGDVVKISVIFNNYDFESIVVKDSKGLSYIYGIRDEDLCKFNIQKIKSFNELKDGEKHYYGGITVVIDEKSTLTNKEIQQLLTMEDKEDLLKMEIELALNANDMKTFDKLTSKYNDLGENCIDNLYDKYKKKYDDMKNKELTKEEKMAYLELMMDHYFDLYGVNAKEHKDFLHSVEEYNKLSSECVVR